MKFRIRIITSIMTLFLMIVALGTGVFAWFTINTKTSAENLVGSAQTLDGGLYISLDGINWTTNLSLENILTEDFEFKDLTTSNGILITDLEGANDYITNNDYAEFDIHFLTGLNKNKVYLEKIELIDIVPGATWISEVDIDIGSETIYQNTVLHANLSDSIRISTEEQGTNHANIFEKYGSNLDVLVDTSEINHAYFSNTIGFGGFALKYYNKIMGNTQEAEPSRGDIVLEEDGNTNTLIATTEINPNISHTLDPSFTNYQKITVRIWLEGWDGEAFNAIHSGKVGINFNFTVKEL